jgi:hypothetical protein
VSEEYHCLVCKAIIPLDDVNVAKDIALCRVCGKTFAFSSVCGASEISLDALDAPPNCVRLHLDPINGTRLTYRRISPALFFLVPFTAFWSGFSLFGIYGEQIRNGKFDLTQSLFGLPFLIGTIILVSAIVFLVFGKWVITLNQGDGIVFVGLGGIGWTRRFAYNQSSLVCLQASSVIVNDAPQRGILVRTGDEDFLFGALIKQEAKQFIAAVILKHIAAS